MNPYKSSDFSGRDSLVPTKAWNSLP